MRDVLKSEVKINLFINLVFHLQESDEFISLRLSLHSEHYIIASIVRKFVEYRMVREINILKSDLFSIVGADFNLPNESFEESHKLVDMVIAIAFGVSYHV